jgi:hypothetical protein
VVHGEQEVAAGVVVHLPDLLGRGVLGDPGVVGADAKDGEVGALDAFEGVGVGGVAGEEDA